MYTDTDRDRALTYTRVNVSVRSYVKDHHSAETTHNNHVWRTY